MVRFEWDSAKDRLNRAKHGISFESAKEVFEDPYCISFVDRIDEGEERWHAIGAVEGLIVIVIRTGRRVQTK